MQALKLIGILLSLGLDTLAVSLALGVHGNIGHRRRVAASFALFEGLMPVIGFLLGGALRAGIGTGALYGGIGLLILVGLWMIWESRSPDEGGDGVSSWPVLLLASLSVSMDELAIGFSLGLLGVPIILAVILIAAQAFVITTLGMRLGQIIGDRFSSHAELLAGLVLITLGIVLALQQAM